MEVPDIILNFVSLLSTPPASETEALAGQAAKISTPGAAISGCPQENSLFHSPMHAQDLEGDWYLFVITVYNMQQWIGRSQLYTLRMLGVTGFGPLDEKEGTYGDKESLPSVVLNIVAVGLL